MSLLRWLGLAREDGSAAPAGDEPASIRHIAEQLDALPEDQARFLAAFSYVLARVAQADLEIGASESAEMERLVARVAGLGQAEATLAVEIAKSQARHLGGTENYVVTREFRRVSTREQRVRLLEALFAVAAADGSISSLESAEIYSISDELGFTRAETNSLRSRWRDKLSVFQTTSED
jgi:uncharacterized tellurite resistance protein B-like protein